MTEIKTKCERCVYLERDHRGFYCGCRESTEYGLLSVYGWCEQFEPADPAYERAIGA